MKPPLSRFAIRLLYLACLLFSAALAAGTFGTASLATAQDETRPAHHSPYKAINVHRHCYSPSEKELLAEFEVMERVGVDKVVVLLMDKGWSSEHSPGGNLADWMKIQAKYPEKLVVFGYINFKKMATDATFFTDIVKEVETQHRMGAKGLKMWKDLGMYLKDTEGKLVRIDDPRLDPFYAKLGELGMPVLIHSADPREYWYPITLNSLHYGTSGRPRHYENKNMPSWESLMEQRDNVLKKHPKTTFIGAHFGSETFDLEKLGKTFDAYPNFSVDCSARLRILGRLNRQAVQDFFKKYQDRILFGIDGSMPKYDSDDTKAKSIEKGVRFYSRHLEYFETDHLDIIEPFGSNPEWLRIPGVKLPPEVLEKFYRKNAQRLIPALRDK